MYKLIIVLHSIPFFLPSWGEKTERSTTFLWINESILDATVDLRKKTGGQGYFLII